MLRPTTLVIAEDDDDDYLLFSLAVDGLPCKTDLRRVDDGEKLMELLLELLPDFLFLDILLPRKNGILCIREIRANPRYDNIPVIMFSAISDARNISLCYQEGAGCFIQKPATVPELTEILATIFSKNWKHNKPYPSLSAFLVNRPEILRA